MYKAVFKVFVIVATTLSVGSSWGSATLEFPRLDEALELARSEGAAVLEMDCGPVGEDVQIELNDHDDFYAIFRVQGASGVAFVEVQESLQAPFDLRATVYSTECTDRLQ
jgi:hypothetical protein